MDAVTGRRAAARLLASSLRGRGRDLAAWAVWSAIEAAPAFLSGRLIALAVDHGFLHRATLTGLGYLALLGVSVIVGAWGTRQAYRRLARVVEPFRDELVRRTVRAALSPAAVLSDESDTAVVARLTQQVEIVREAYASVLMVAQGFLITSVSALLGLLTLVPSVVVLVLGPLALGVIVFISLLGRMGTVQRASILADERVSASASAAFGGLRDVVACGGEEAVETAIASQISAQARATTALARFSAIRSLAIALGGLTPIVLILLRAPSLTRAGVSTGAILGALAYVLNAVHPALQTFIRGVGNTGLWLLVTVWRIVQATEPRGVRSTLPPATRGPARDRPDGDGALRLTGVTFAYGERADPVIEALDLSVPAGDHVAIVGPSGVGKSTLANLMSGILGPQSGSVRYGTAQAADLGPAELAHRRALIPQEAYLFSGSVRENLTYLCEDASDRELDLAVRELGAGQLIERLGGYDAPVKVEELSAGERQLLTLIRAYLAPAPLIILDEATCHLDPQAEARAEEAFTRRGGTLIVIAHRISSALRARRILVLDGARAVLGTHEELLIRSPLYRDLVGHWDAGGTASAPSTPWTRHRRLRWHGVRWWAAWGRHRSADGGYTRAAPHARQGP